MTQALAVYGNGINHLWKWVVEAKPGYSNIPVYNFQPYSYVRIKIKE
jgi:hypothetical protein